MSTPPPRPASSPPNPPPPSPGAPLRPTEDLNVTAMEPMVSPRQLKHELPMTAGANRTVVESRDAIKAVLAGMDKRVLVIVGPCSMHDGKAALEYAQRLADIRRQLAAHLFMVMRVYFEKPRTTIGWEGLLDDPHLDGTFDINTGVRQARQLLLAITELGVPAATEFLDPVTPQYLADLVGWVAIGARTTESQTHRQMASGLSMPVGYKNSTDGNLQVAMDAMKSAGSPHGFLGMDEDGRTVIVRTRGNKWGHLVLRGGRGRPNYDPKSIAQAAKCLQQEKLPACIMVDCSHANSGKKAEKQEIVWKSVVEQRVAGNGHLMGMMLESNLVEGAQPMQKDLSQLRYGVSITDECIGWDKTEELLRHAHAALGA